MTGTKSDLVKKHPIGTRIKFVTRSYSSNQAKKDRGKIGKIVGFDHLDPLIFLPESKHISCYSKEQCPVSWGTGWSSLEIVSQKNVQLVFSFMEQS